MPNVRFEDVTEGNCRDFEHLLICLFPVPYPKSFMRDILKGKIHAVMAFLGECPKPSACMSWRMKSHEVCELLNFGVLVLQRRQGIGTQLLNRLLESHPNCDIELHVHSANEDAVNFYQSKGFAIDKNIPHYYPRLEPDNAYLMTLSREN